MDNLKPCPFCDDEGDVSLTDLGHCVWVQCFVCGEGENFVYNTKEEAIEAWNRRVDE